jgi:acetylornithine deacetylase/succinyl-diaminopimelate desuccinylase-like protein
MAAEATTHATARARVLETIEQDRQDLVELCLEMGNTPSPRAKERQQAEKVVRWLSDNGIESWLQPITAESANAVGLIRGIADGTSLILDAHIDTGSPLPANASVESKRIHGAWEENGLLYGYGVVNDKGQLAAFMIAARALVKAGVRLKGDLYIAAVAHETGAASVGDRQGIDYPGEGFGSWWLFNRGVTADYALVGETSGFGLVQAECGKVGLEIRLTGRFVYTPRLERGDSWQDHPSALVRSAHLVVALEEWARQYERRARVEFEGGTIVPRAQVESVQAQARQTVVLLYAFLAPGANPRAVRREVRDFLRERGFDCEVTACQWSRGHIARNAEPLVAAVHDAHLSLFKTEPPRPPTPEVSMWRDVNMFNEVGIPSICYGPPRQYEPYSDANDRAVKIDDMVLATQVYALTVMNLCGEA